MIPESYSIFRGHSKQGMAEDAVGIAGYREQDIAADGPFADQGTRRRLRDWMTFDTGAADFGRTGGKLEGWSCFPFDGYYVTVHLGFGRRSPHDPRPGYFAHARAWPRDADDAHFDPGLYLGNPAAFDEPWADNERPAANLLPSPVLTGLDHLKASGNLAPLLLGYLFQGMLEDYPLIVSAPLDELTVGGRMASLAAFARGALPARLRQRCSVIVFTRTPQRFIGSAASNSLSIRANLLVVPEDEATDALASDRRAVLLSARGTKLQGPELAPWLWDYARAVSSETLQFPRGLSAFTHRFDNHVEHPRDYSDRARWVALIYRLAVAESAPKEQAASLYASLFSNFLLKKASEEPDIPWRTLISPAEWNRFPTDAIARFVLQSKSELTPGAQQLQAELERGMAHNRQTLDQALDDWWNPRNPDCVRRFLELSDKEPALISPPGIGRLGATLGTRTLVESLDPVHGLLRTELDQGLLSRRDDPEALRWLGKQPQASNIVNVLIEGAATGDLAAETVVGFLNTARKAQPEISSALFKSAADKLLELEPARWQPLGELPNLVIGALPRLNLDDRPRWAKRIQQLAQEFAEDDDSQIFLLLIAVSLTLDPNLRGAMHALVTDRLARLQDRDRRRTLVGQILASRYDPIDDSYFFSNDGARTLPWLSDVADLLLAHVERSDSPDVRRVIRLAQVVTADDQLNRLHRLLTRCYNTDPQVATEYMIRSSTWGSWRRHIDSRLQPGQGRMLAWSWLQSSALQCHRGRSAMAAKGPLRRPSRNLESPVCDTPMEDWSWAMEQLDVLTVDQVRKLIKEQLIPWIWPFQKRQAQDLANRCLDLKALLILLDHLAHEHLPDLDSVWEHSRLDSSVSWDAASFAMAWSADSSDSQCPTVKPAAVRELLGTGEGEEQRLVALVRKSVLNTLPDNPDDALALAKATSFCRSRGLLSGIRQWLLESDWLERATPEEKESLQASLSEVQGKWPDSKESPVGDALPFTEAFRLDLTRAYPMLARFVMPSQFDDLDRQIWLRNVLSSLRDGDDQSAAIRRFIKEVREFPAQPKPDARQHPFFELTETFARLPRDEKEQLRQDGRNTLRRLLNNEPAAFAHASTQGFTVIPLFHFALVLDPAADARPGRLGEWLFHEPAAETHRGNPEWHGALKESLTLLTHDQSRGDFELAVATWDDCTQDLPTHQRQLFEDAFQGELRALENGDELKPVLTGRRSAQNEHRTHL